MHKIKSITVIGFRRQQEPIELRLSENVNFLIGRNGTGKTSLINLINACLTVEEEVLSDTIFERVTIRFKEAGKTAVPNIEVEKLDVRKSAASFRYTVRESANGPPEVFEIGLGRRRTRLREFEEPRRVAGAVNGIKALRSVLGEWFNHTWLSLNRGHVIADERHPYEYHYDEVPFEVRSGVDRKLDDVLSNLKDYYFELDRSVSAQTRQFQKDWFRSFLASQDSDVDILNTKIDFDEEKAAVSAIFDRFEVPPESYERELEDHVTFGKQALEKYRSKDAIRMSEFFNVYDVVRLHRLVEQWQVLQEAQKQILEPKSDFISIASGMLYRKSISLNEVNEVIVHADDSLNIPVDKLSSGEKQLLIFLAETLLQQKREYIFLADEPELSLHVEWQEQLVSNLLKVNPNAQVLFATHSPDIVGPYGEHIFSMEQLVK